MALPTKFVLVGNLQPQVNLDQACTDHPHLFLNYQSTPCQFSSSSSTLIHYMELSWTSSFIHNKHGVFEMKNRYLIYNVLKTFWSHAALIACYMISNAFICFWCFTYLVHFCLLTHVISKNLQLYIFYSWAWFSNEMSKNVSFYDMHVDITL